MFLFLTSNAFSQSQNQGQQDCECSSTSLSRNIELDDSSDTEDIKIEVSDEVKKMFIGVNSIIESGYLTVEIYDPSGNKKGNFSVESQLKSSNKKKEQVCGQMQKQIDDPEKGTWRVKLIPKNAVGQIQIQTSQY